MHDTGRLVVYRRSVPRDGKRRDSIARRCRLIAAYAARSGFHIEVTHVEKSDRATASSTARR